MYKILAKFEFSETFINWIKILNNNVMTSVLQCGHFSKSFEVKRGCRQGDPIAPSLFILCAQILAFMIYQNPNVRGILINNFEIKLTQFADDTTLILDGSQESLQTALNIIETYGTMSGLKMNTEKTKIIWLGRKKTSKDKLNVTQNLEWGSAEFKLLGITFSTNLDAIPKLNFEGILNNVAKEMANWNKRNITTIGRIALIKSLFLSKLNHIFLTIPSLNEDLLQRIEDLLFKFLWHNKPDKIKRKCITQSYGRGGLKMIDIRNFIKSLKITWVRRIFNTPDNLWVKLFHGLYFNPENLITKGSNWIQLYNQNISNRFWYEVFDAYRELLLTYNPKNKQDLLLAPMWYNPKMGFTNDFSKRFHNKNATFICDFINSDGYILSHQELQNITGTNLSWYDNTIINLSIKKYLKIANISLPVSIVRPPLPLY